MRASCQALLRRRGSDDRRIAPEQQVRRVQYKWVLNETVGLPSCNGQRILPKYLLDHAGSCNNLQLDIETRIFRDAGVIAELTRPETGRFPPSFSSFETLCG